MSSSYGDVNVSGGIGLDSESAPFNLELARRNSMIERQGMKLPRYLKTGTTICGVVYANGVVLGADTRSTNGDTVADKNCEKIHYIAPNIYCCGAGTAADTEATTNMVASALNMHRYGTNGRTSRVITALTMLKSHLFKYQGNVSAALVLGGFDINGPHLFTVYPHGSSDSLPYATMGSGSLAAMSIFEAGYKENMTKEEAMKLVADAIKSGVFNDLGSGSNVDLCIITKEGKEYLRNYECPNPRPYAIGRFSFAKGTTPVLRSTMLTLKDVVVEEGADAMEVGA